MAKHGSIGEYVPGTQSSWKCYVEQLECYFVANAVVTDTQKRAILLSVCGSQVYQRIRSLVAPISPKDVEYDDIIKAATIYFEPASTVILERFHFFKREQKSDETVSTYIAELKRFAEPCLFKSQITIDELMRDRFVCGIADQRIRTRLFTEDDKLTFAKAQQIALATETALKSSLEVRAELSGNKSIHKIDHR